MEPLDDQEREFARILGALPGGEPPPALDAAILRAATNAAASSKRPGARILASAGALWGIGTAAAAVLALGVAWQLRYGYTRAPLAESAARVHVVADRAEDEPVQVDLGPAAQAVPAPMSAPPPEDLAQKEAPQPPLRRQRVAQPERDAAPATAAAQAAPEPFAADQLDEHVAREAAATANAAEAGARAESELELKGRREEAMAAKSAYAPAPAAAPPPASAEEVQSRTDAGSAAPVGQAAASASALGGLAADSNAKPAARKPMTWLTEIRSLRDRGRIEEARAALIEFRKKYPKWVIPTDLAPLLSE
jgi:Meckel syndrome type 1 protein